MTRLLLALILSLPSQALFAQLSAADKALIQECTANVAPGGDKLSPETADKCVKGLNEGEPELITRYAKQDPEAAGKVIGYNSALIDLKRIIVKQNGFHGARALTRVLEQPDCALCDMSLGPKAEAIFGWAGKYASERQAGLQKDVRTWDALGAIRTKSLASADYGKTKDSWNGQDILERYSELSSWAKKETDKLVAFSKTPGAAKVDIAALIAVLREDLIFSEDGPYRAKLDALSTSVKEAASKPVDNKPTAADKKSKELNAAGDRLASLSPDGQGDYLAAAFDKASSGKGGALPPGGKPAAGGTPAKPVAPVKMTAEEEKALGEAMIRLENGKPSGYLVDVMNETAAGKRTVGFYGDKKYEKAGSNKLNFGFTREPGVFGYWNPGSKEIKINSEVAEEFAAKRGMTVGQLMKDKAAMKDLALYISPTMVHESEHQNQTARAIDKGTDFRKYGNGTSDDPYTRAKENLSNKWSAEHMIEYCSKNGGPACYQKFHAMHADNAEKYMQGGVAALDTLKAPLYPKIDSLEGGAAREFKSAQSYAAYLKALEDKNRTNPKGMSVKEREDMKKYRELMDTRFKWYTIIYQESTDAETSALAFRKKYGTPGSGLSVPTL